MWLFEHESIKSKQNERSSASVILATFQLLHSHLWLVATILDNTDVEHDLHCRKSYWTALIQIKAFQ